MDIKVIFSSGGKFNKKSQQQITEKDTFETAEKVVSALTQVGHSVEMLKITPSKVKSVREIKTDAVFNLCEWAGKDSPLGVKVLQNLEAEGIPYTGGDSKSYSWCCDKITMKRMFDKLNIPTPNWVSIKPKDTNKDIKQKIDRLIFPIIIKPAYEHCGIGIDYKSVIHSKKKYLKRIVNLLNIYKEPIIVEEFIDGREFTTSILKNHIYHVFPPVEVIFKNKKTDKILSFDTKWKTKTPAYASRVITDKKIALFLKKLTKDIFIKMNCRGYARLDMRMNGNKIYVLEININPSILPEECYGWTVSTEAAGWNFTKLVDEIAKAAVIKIPLERGLN